MQAAKNSMEISRFFHTQNFFISFRLGSLKFTMKKFKPYKLIKKLCNKNKTIINMIRTRYMSFLMKLYHNKYIWTPFLSNLEHVRLKYESKRFYKFIFQWNHFSRKLGKKKQKFRLWRQKFLSGLSTTGLDIEEVSYKSWRSESLLDLFGIFF